MSIIPPYTSTLNAKVDTSCHLINNTCLLYKSPLAVTWMMCGKEKVAIHSQQWHTWSSWSVILKLTKCTKCNTTIRHPRSPRSPRSPRWPLFINNVPRANPLLEPSRVVDNARPIYTDPQTRRFSRSGVASVRSRMTKYYTDYQTNYETDLKRW